MAHTGQTVALRAACALALCCGTAAAQVPLPLEQAAVRRVPDFAPALEGERVTVQGTVSSTAIELPFIFHLGIQDDDGFGLILEGSKTQLAGLQPGMRIEARGTISKRAGLVLLRPAQIEVLANGPAPAPKRLGIADVQSFRYLGTLVSVDGRVVDRGENTGGEYLLIGDQKKPLKVFLPLVSTRSGPPLLRRLDLGDRVRVTGLAYQYCPFAPYNRYFEVIIGDDDAVVLLSKRWLISPELFAICLAALVFSAAVWWMRERHMAAQRNMVRNFYSLGEEMTAAGAAPGILRRLSAVLPRVLKVSGVHLYLYNRTGQTLDAVSERPEPPGLSVVVFPPEGSLPAGPAVCFRNQALLTIPDTRRSPFFPDGRSGPPPRAVMFVPMFADAEMLGVLEIFDNKTVHEFSADERVLTQHLANQIGIALRLMEEKSIREQLSRSEKLAAIGQLASGVAAELRSPLEKISALSQAIAAEPPAPDWGQLQALTLEAKHASEIVSRLVSFTQPERSEARRIELNTLLRNLIEFRRKGAGARGFELHDLLCPSPVFVLGSQGQLERVFLDLLVQAEQSLAEAAEKALRIGSSVLGRRVLVEISYTATPAKPAWAAGEPARQAEFAVPGEGVTRGIVRSHGGELRLVRSPEGECRLEVELPLAPAQLASAEGGGSRPFTCLVVDPDVPGRSELVRLLTNRGCRLVPVAGGEEGHELVQRMRFDVVFCSVRLPGLNWVQFSDQVRKQIGAFVLLSEGFDFELSRGLLSADTHVLAKPVVDDELDRLLAAVEARLASPDGGFRGLQIVRPEKKAIHQ